MSEQATYTEHVYQEYSCGSFTDPLHQREEIVRCKDCRYYEDYTGCCTRRDYIAPMAVTASGYCAWGERREQ